MKPILSEHFRGREPVEAADTTIAKVSPPMHPAVIRRLSGLQALHSPFRGGVVKYTPTVGRELFVRYEAQRS